jgi:ribosomal protein S27E
VLQVKIYAVCPECGDDTFVKTFDDGEQGFECLGCGEFLLPEDLTLEANEEEE